MSRYNQNLSLIDIFNEKKLMSKLPLVRYKETERDGGGTRVRTNMYTVGRYVYYLSQRGARPYYKPLRTSKNGDFINIGGNLVGDLDGAVDNIYNTLVANKGILEITANQMDIIRDALKEAEYNKRTLGKESKLFLREKSIQQIQNLSDKQTLRLLRDIFDNIEYSGNYPKTMAKWSKILDMDTKDVNSRRRQRYWEHKVGLIGDSNNE